MAKKRSKKPEIKKVDKTELIEVRKQEAGDNGDTTKKPGIVIGTLNVFTSSARELLDPIHKVCYPRLEAHYEERYKKPFDIHASKWLMLDLALLVVVGMLVASLIIVYKMVPASAPQSAVSISLLRPQTAISGQETELWISYANSNNLPIAGASLSVELPDSFVLSGETRATASTDPKTPNRLNFMLGDLLPNSRGDIHLTGTAYGPTDSAIPIYMEMDFWTQGSAERDETAIYYELPISDSVVELEMSLEDPFIRDTANRIDMTLSNTSEETLTGLAVQLNVPEGFRATGSAPYYLSWPPRWNVAVLEPGEKKTMTVFGSLPSGASSTFSAEVLMENDGIRQLLEKTDTDADALTTGFAISQSLITPADSSFVRPGEKIKVEIRYANNGDQTMNDVIITSVQRGLGNIEEENFIWTPDNTQRLTNIAPGESGSIIAEYSPLNIEIADTETRPIVIEIESIVAYSVAGDDLKRYAADANPITLPVATELELETGSLYYSKVGDQIGVGPLPPHTGKTTKLWAVISISNNLNGIRNAVLEARLPEGIDWTGRTSITDGEPIAYIPSERRVIWNIGEIAPSEEISLSASIELAVTPEQDDIGEVLHILKDIRINGIDSATGAPVSAEGNPISTGVRFGTWTQQSGKVIE
jgi:hypothetical protein